jgi:dTDP-4-dehydrorhamnose reductase
MRVTIFGATGLLGRALTQAWEGDELTPLGSKDADIRERAQVDAAIQQSRPDWIILAAAYADVDGCELDPERATAVNCRGAIYVAQAARESGSRLLYVSTDYVFDGAHTVPYEVSDLRDPINVYGRSKAEAEVALLDIVPECCVARTSWLFGTGGKSFPDAILAGAEQQAEIAVVNDQRGCPTYTKDAAEAMVQLCRKQAKGIVHVTNHGDSTRFDQAREIIAAAGLKTRVLPANSEEIKRPAARPKYSVLSTKSLESHGITLPSWQDGVRRYMEARQRMRASAAND